MPGFLKNIAKGYLGNLANQKLGGIDNPVARRLAGQVLGGIPGIDGILPGLNNPPRNPDQNLLFGARRLSELQLRGEIQGQTDLASANFRVPEQDKVAQNYDWRARLRPKAGGAAYVYGTNYTDGDETNILQPLINSGGLVWQYTPQIFVAAGTNYQQYDLQGMNYPIYAYQNSRPPELPVAADFTANNIDEARYLLAIMHFLKVITKSYSGDAAVSDGIAGTPPPVLLFEYLGEHGFNKVPVIIKDYSIQLDPEVDYVPVHYKMKGADTVTYVPTSCFISINMSVSYTPKKLRKQFDIKGLTTGAAYSDGFI